MSLFFDIGANRGEATYEALKQGYDKIISVEPAPKMYKLLASNFFDFEQVTPLKFAVSDTLFERVEFYECVEDGLSTVDLRWLTGDDARYRGKQYQTISATTCTLDWLAEQYGTPDLVKIDVEGAETLVISGIRKHRPGKLCFEWTLERLEEHLEDIDYLASIGYTECALQFIEWHLVEPAEYRNIKTARIDLRTWIEESTRWWESEGWETAGRMHQPADAGMLWIR